MPFVSKVVFLHKTSKTWLNCMAKSACIGPLLFNLISWIQLCDKKNLTFIDCCVEFFSNESLNMLLKAHFITFFKTCLIRLYLCSLLMTDPIYTSQISIDQVQDLKTWRSKLKSPCTIRLLGSHLFFSSIVGTTAI